MKIGLILLTALFLSLPACGQQSKVLAADSSQRTLARDTSVAEQRVTPPAAADPQTYDPYADEQQASQSVEDSVVSEAFSDAESDVVLVYENTADEPWCCDMEHWLSISSFAGFLIFVPVLLGLLGVFGFPLLVLYLIMRRGNGESPRSAGSATPQYPPIPTVAKKTSETADTAADISAETQPADEPKAEKPEEELPPTP